MIYAKSVVFLYVLIGFPLPSYQKKRVKRVDCIGEAIIQYRLSYYFSITISMWLLSNWEILCIYKFVCKLSNVTAMTTTILLAKNSQEIQWKIVSGCYVHVCYNSNQINCPIQIKQLRRIPSSYYIDWENNSLRHKSY